MKAIDTTKYRQDSIQRIHALKIGVQEQQTTAGNELSTEVVE